jgi:D-lactate dehydrogenase
MRVAVFETEEWEHEACLRLQPEHVVVCTRDALNDTTVNDHAGAEIVSPFVNSRLDAGVLARLPSLKMIATRSTGYDHIDLDYCRAHGITVCNVPNYGDATVAEHAFALLLAISHRLVDAVERTRRGTFSQEGLRGFDLRGRRLGVIGTGRIGRRVIEIAKGFGMEVVAFDLRPDEAAAGRLGFRYADFETVLAEADVVTLHVPATPGAAHLVSDREFTSMKNGAVLINTARGSVVDVAALVRALRSGKLRAAGLDVLPQEPLLRDEAEVFRTDRHSEPELRSLLASNVLLQFPNVLVTPHNAYNTEDAVHRIIASTLDNIEAFARGVPQNVVS